MTSGGPAHDLGAARKNSPYISPRPVRFFFHDRNAPTMNGSTYTVYRSEWSGWRQSERVLHTGATFDEARRLQRAAEETLVAEPGYRPNVMSRPLIGVRLERTA